MRQFGAFAAKTHLSELLAAVSTGEKIIITLHGQKVAMLIPYVGYEKNSASSSAVRAIRNLRKGTTLGKNLSIKVMQAEGRQ